jgi:hypothetical protein
MRDRSSAGNLSMTNCQCPAYQNLIKTQDSHILLGCLLPPRFGGPMKRQFEAGRRDSGEWMSFRHGELRILGENSIWLDLDCGTGMVTVRNAGAASICVSFNACFSRAACRQI